MCQKPNVQKMMVQARKKASYLAIGLPIIAGILHLRVFYHAAFSTLTIDRKMPIPELIASNAKLDIAVCIAYVFDLLCCYVFQVIPFSRVNVAVDIAIHHLPILLLFQPLMLPVNVEKLYFLDPLIHKVIQHDQNNGPFKIRLADRLLTANGFGFISSLNEAIMCFQRVEMNLQGATTFRDIPNMKHRVFTSRFMVGIELYFKLGIFWVFSVIGCKACFDLDQIGFQYLDEVHGDELSLWGKAKIIYSSAIFIRTVLFRLFVVSMYPVMGWRTMKKIQQYHEQGNSPVPAIVANTSKKAKAN